MKKASRNVCVSLPEELASLLKRTGSNVNQTLVEKVSRATVNVLLDALRADEDEIEPYATINGDLEAESIDYLDIEFRMESALGFRIPRGVLFPAEVLSDEQNYTRGDRGGVLYTEDVTTIFTMARLF